MSPALPLQRTVFEALHAIPALTGRAKHRIEPNLDPPYAKIGDDMILADFDSGEFYDCNVVIYLVAASKPQLKELAASVQIALEQKISIEGFMTCEWGFESCTFSTAADGLTERAILEFVYLVQPE